MGWLDLFRRKREAPPVTVTRGEDVAVFAPAAEATALQMALAREGWSCRLFAAADEAIWPGLVRNLPVALVVRAGVDVAPVAAAVAADGPLRGVPLVVCADAPRPEGALHVPTDSVEDLARALDALRDAVSL